MTRKPSATPTAEDISRADALMLAAQAGVESAWLQAQAFVPTMAALPSHDQAMLKQAYQSGFYAGMRWLLEKPPVAT